MRTVRKIVRAKPVGLFRENNQCVRAVSSGACPRYAVFAVGGSPLVETAPLLAWLQGGHPEPLRMFRRMLAQHLDGVRHPDKKKGP